MNSAAPHRRVLHARADTPEDVVKIVVPVETRSKMEDGEDTEVQILDTLTIATAAGRATEVVIQADSSNRSHGANAGTMA